MRKNYRFILVIILIIVVVLIIFGKKPGMGTSSKNSSTNNSQNIINDFLQNNKKDNDGKLYKDKTSGVTVHYDEIPESKYVKLTKWPPFVRATNLPFTCKLASDTENSSYIKNMETINNQVYCITIQTQSANGYNYLNYIYETSLYGKTVTASFSFEMPLCINFAANEKSECNTKQRTFFDSLNGTIDKIVKSAEL